MKRLGTFARWSLFITLPISAALFIAVEVVMAAVAK
jgi:hypothetical protein